MGAIPRIWRNQRQRYTLTGQVCRHCGRLSLSPRAVCPECHSSGGESDLQLPEAKASSEPIPYILLPIELLRERSYVPVPPRLRQEEDRSYGLGTRRALPGEHAQDDQLNEHRDQ